MNDFTGISKEIFKVLAKAEGMDGLLADVRRRCPKCNSLAVEIFNLLRPYIGPTGIYRCPNPNCAVETFDPKFPEALPR